MILMADFGTQKYRASSSISARLAFPFSAGAWTVTRYSESVNFVIAANFALGFTVTEIFRAMAYHSAATATGNSESGVLAEELSALVSGLTQGSADRI
jgi:hypothetical protein